MSNVGDFNDRRDLGVIAECIARAQPVVGVLADIAEPASPGLTEPKALTDALALECPVADTTQLPASVHMFDPVATGHAAIAASEHATGDAEVADVGIVEASEVQGMSNEVEATVHGWMLEETGLPAAFSVDEGGVFWTNPASEDSEPIRVCGELHVTALVRDAASGNWGRALMFVDPDGVPHQWVMPMALLVGDTVDLRRELAQQGLDIGLTPRTRSLLVEYIANCKPAARARCVQKTGWCQSVFVLPELTIGVSHETVLYQSEKPVSQYSQAGTLDDWKHNVSRLCAGNSRLILAVCAAFAGPLLHLAGHDSGGVHFIGPSSIGKTTLLAVGACVFGGPEYIQTWRATGNGLEGLCELHNDSLLVLDEMGEVEAREAGSIAYMIGNGAGKTRSDRNGDARTKKTWRLMFLSSGEVGLAQHMTEGGKVARAGQEVRLIDLPADAGAGHGVFESLHEFDNGGALSNALKASTREQYGVAGMAYIEAVVANVDDLRGHLKTLVADFVRANLPREAAGQAERVCARFAIMAVAGELATQYGVTGWESGTATRAAAACYQDWLDQRGGPGNGEREKILASVRAFFETHGESRFAELTLGNERVTMNRAGFRKCAEGGQEYYVLPEAYKREVCTGFDPRLVSKVLIEAGWLQPGKDQKSAQKKSLPGLGETRVYVITAAMWR